MNELKLKETDTEGTEGGMRGVGEDDKVPLSTSESCRRQIQFNNLSLSLVQDGHASDSVPVELLLVR